MPYSATSPVLVENDGSSVTPVVVNRADRCNASDVATKPLEGWTYLKKRLHLDQARQIPSSRSLANFKQNKNLIQQCYTTNDMCTIQGSRSQTLACLGDAKDPTITRPPMSCSQRSRLSRRTRRWRGPLFAAVIKGYKNFRRPIQMQFRVSILCSNRSYYPLTGQMSG